MKEIWLNIAGYEGHYQVSSLGRIKSLERKVTHRGSWLSMPEKIKDLQTNEGGYVIVRLYKDGVGNNFKVSRIVALHCIPNPLGYKYVNHKKGNKLDNRASELEWCTKSENELHAYKHGLKVARKGEKVNTAVLDSKQVVAIRQIAGQHSERFIAKMYNVSKSAIHAIIAGKSWKHI